MFQNIQQCLQHISVGLSWYSKLPWGICDNILPRLVRKTEISGWVSWGSELMGLTAVMGVRVFSFKGITETPCGNPSFRFWLNNTSPEGKSDASLILRSSVSILPAGDL